MPRPLFQTSLHENVDRIRELRLGRDRPATHVATCEVQEGVNLEIKLQQKLFAPGCSTPFLVIVESNLSRCRYA